MSEIIEVVKVTYQEVVQAMAEYYGTEQFLKIAGAGATVEQFLNALKAVPNYNAIVSASGKIIGYEKSITSTIATGSAVSSTATTTVATTTAFGATATETGVAVTGVGQTTAGTAGSFIFGEVLPAVAAVSIGTVLGVGVDALLYESNPDYWDEVLPTLNPQTWDDIILGHDTKIPLLHNTRNGNTYIDADAVAYMAQVYAKSGAFNTIEIATLPDKPNFKIYPFSTGIEIYTAKSNGVTYGISNSNWNGCKVVAYKVGNTYRAVLVNTIPTDSESTISITTRTGNTITENTYKLGTVNDYTVNNKKIYFAERFVWNDSDTTLIKISEPTLQSTSDSRFIYYGCFYGDITVISESEDGFSIIGNTPKSIDFPSDLSLSDGVLALRNTYPEWFENAVTYPVIQPDGTETTKTFLPVPIADNLINPVNTNYEQNYAGNYPNEKTKTETIENVITPAINAGIDAGTPDNDNSTGEEDTPPIIAPITPVQTGLGAVYIPTLEQLKNFSAWLWSSDIVEQIKRLFANPMDGIIGLHQVFFTPTANGSEKIQTGYLTSTVASSYTTTRYYTIDCGEIALKEKSGNVFDYSPYTSVELYLPFIGIVPLDVGAVMRSTIHVSYECDVLTGACLANVEISRDGNKNVLYTFGGSCALQYPLSSGSYVGILGAIAGIAVNVGTAIATGGATLPLNIGGIASSIAGAKTSVASSGGYSGNTGAMGIKKPYLIIKRSFKAMPRNYSKYIGNPLGNTKTLNELSGYTECEVVHISGNMTTEEKNEIETILKNGVII